MDLVSALASGTPHTISRTESTTECTYTLPLVTSDPHCGADVLVFEGLRVIDIRKRNAKDVIENVAISVACGLALGLYEIYFQMITRLVCDASTTFRCHSVTT
jgi:hypothetical protein